MGARMAAQLLKVGHQLTVWNRSPAAAQPLLHIGAQWADTPRQAARQADVVIAMVRDDEAARAVWCDAQTGALAGMRRAAIAIDCATLTPGWIREWAQAAASLGVHAVEAPVSGSRPAAELGRLVFLLGGDAEAVAAARPVLADLGNTAHHVGPVGAGALTKLATNALLGIHVTALAELQGWLQQAGADVERVMQAVAGTPVWAPVDQVLLSSMLRRDYAPQFPVDLIVKDIGYLQAQRFASGSTPIAAAALSVFQLAQADGLGGENMTAVAKLYA